MSDISHNPYPVNPTGYLIGSFAAAVLFGCHTAQVYQYYSKFKSDPWRLHLLVGWIYSLSALQILIIVSTAWKYFVDGIGNPKIWGEFWWPLSFQDGLIPIVAFTAQCYFGRRAYILLGRRKWFLWIVTVWASIAALCGIGLAITAFLWARDPWVSKQSFSSRAIGVPSQVVAILWMGLSASLDGILTITLIRCLWRARSPTFDNTNDLIRRLIALTLETVLLTHLCGAIMCILFLSQPAAHRTKTTAFWIFLEIITELYSLSVVFTINARSAARRTLYGDPKQPTPASPPSSPAPPAVVPSLPTRDFRDQRQLDFAVEGFQEVSRFSYHFPAGTGQASLPDPPSLTDNARKIDQHYRGSDEEGFQPSPLELSPIRGNADTQEDLEKGNEERDGKDYVDSESSTVKASEESARQVDRMRKRLTLWNRK